MKDWTRCGAGQEGGTKVGALRDWTSSAGGPRDAAVKDWTQEGGGAKDGPCGRMQARDGVNVRGGVRVCGAKERKGGMGGDVLDEAKGGAVAAERRDGQWT